MAKRTKKSIPNSISFKKEIPSNPSLKEKKKDKCKMNVLQNLKNTNANIILVFLFENSEEHLLALFELLNGIDVDTNISTSTLVWMICYFK